MSERGGEVSDGRNENKLSSLPSNTNEQDEEEETWLALDDSWEENGQGYGFVDESTPVVGNLPAQLHPAVSMGMRRVSSCYFSIQSASEATNSVADLLSLLEETSTVEETGGRERLNDSLVQEETAANDNNVQSAKCYDASDVLFHDIMMHVFTFLDAKALATFSQTGRRPNFECFYFLQLQLQRAMLVGPDSKGVESDDSLDAIAGVGCLSRLAAMDEQAARSIVQEYNDSNSTLRQMPLSHSVAFIRHALRRNGFRPLEGAPPNALAGAAFVITLMGAASFVGSTSPESYTTVLPNALFKVGLAGSLMRAGVTAKNHAARKLSNDDNDDENDSDGGHHAMSMRDAAEQMARMMQGMPAQMLQQLQSSVMNPDDSDESTRSFQSAIASRMYAAFSSAYGPSEQHDSSNITSHSGNCGKKRRSKRSHKGDVARLDQSVSKIDEQELEAIQEEAMLHPLTPDPYEHLHPAHTDEESHNSESESSTEVPSHASSEVRKLPSGCIGAYSRAVRQASSQVTQLLKEIRKTNFEALSVHEQRQVSTAFIDACTSDDTLSTVKDLVQKRDVIDVDGFYIGSDGAETCALHTAAFNGACRVLEFLCAGIDEHDADKDGGLCNVNLKDANQWTAMHFAAGANSVEAVKILARRGAKLTVEAANGYTPYHWAQRLSNDAVAAELQKLGADQRFLEMGPLSAIASRFFSLIPAH